MARAKIQDEEASLSMTPLIDIVLLLLIFYIVTTSFVDREIQLQLPESAASSIPDEKKVFTIEVGPSGAVALNGKLVSIPLLDATLEAEAAADRIRAVDIRGDRNVVYGRVIEVLGIVKKHGIDAVGIKVKQPPQG